MTPEVDGRLLHFVVAGTYNGMVLIGDRETGSYWDHMTGECVYGPLSGKRLEISPLLHMTASQAAVSHPKAMVAIGRQSRRERLMSWFFDWMRRTAGRFLLPLAKSTMADEDRRLPRWEIGLGVWSDTAAVYYPMNAIKKSSGLLIDDFEGNKVLVYLDKRSHIPAAIFVEAQGARWDGDRIILDSGITVRDGMLRDPKGELLFTARPMQLFSRWFGFALTFGGCRIYG